MAEKWFPQSPGALLLLSGGQLCLWKAGGGGSLPSLPLRWSEDCRHQCQGDARAVGVPGGALQWRGHQGRDLNLQVALLRALALEGQVGRLLQQMHLRDQGHSPFREVDLLRALARVRYGKENVVLSDIVKLTQKIISHGPYVYADILNLKYLYSLVVNYRINCTSLHYCLLLGRRTSGGLCR